MDKLLIGNDCIKKFKTLSPEECSVVCPQLMCFSLEKRGLDGLVANIISVQEEYAPLMPLDLEQTSEGGHPLARQKGHSQKSHLCGSNTQNLEFEPRRYQRDHRRLQGPVFER